jgi:hypothetical protein
MPSTAKVDNAGISPNKPYQCARDHQIMPASKPRVGSRYWRFLDGWHALAQTLGSPAPRVYRSM